MPKVLTIVGMAVAALLVLLFGADLAVQLPFGRPSMLVDVLFLLCAAMLGYMSWSTYRGLT